MPDTKPNNTFPKWVQSVIGALAAAGIVGGIGLAIAGGRLEERVKSVEGNVAVVQETKQEVAVVKNEVKHVKEDVKEVKADVKEVLKQLQQLNGGGQ